MKKVRNWFLAAALALILIGGALATVGWFMGAQTNLPWGGLRIGWITQTTITSTAREIDLTFGEDFDRIDIRLGVADLTIQEGTEFHAAGRLPERVTISTENNALVMRDPGTRGRNVGVQNYYLVLTVPFGVTFDSLNIDNGVGNIDVQNINAAGADITSGVGDIYVQNVEFGNTSLFSGVGNIRAEGVFEGRVNIESGVGDVTLTLPGNREDYAYTIQSGLGNTTIDGSRITGGAARSVANPIADLRLSSGVGTVSVSFRR